MPGENLRVGHLGGEREGGKVNRLRAGNNIAHISFFLPTYLPSGLLGLLLQGQPLPLDLVTDGWGKGGREIKMDDGLDKWMRVV